MAATLNALSSITFRGGLRAGGLNLTWPFVTLKICNGSMIIAVPGKQHLINKQQIHSIELHQGMFSQGVKIIHHHETLESPVIFWSFSARLILEAAREFGYETSKIA